MWKNQSSSAARLNIWSSLVVCSAVVLVSVASDDVERKWIISTCSASLIIATTFSTIYMVPLFEGIRGAVVEFLGIFCALGFWASFVLSEFKPNGRGMTIVFLEDGTEVSIVENANKYYCSWFALIACFLLFTSFIQSNLNIGCAEARKVLLERFSLWSLALFFSVVSMSDAVSILVSTDCLSISKQYCSSVRIVIWVNVCTSVVAVVLIFYKLVKRSEENLMLATECICSAFIFAGFISSIRAVTGQNGVGEKLDNIFHFTWLSFINSIILSHRCSVPFHKYFLVRNEKTIRTLGSSSGTYKDSLDDECITSNSVGIHIEMDNFSKMKPDEKMSKSGIAEGFSREVRNDAIVTGCEENFKQAKRKSERNGRSEMDSHVIPLSTKMNNVLDVNGTSDALISARNRNSHRSHRRNSLSSINEEDFEGLLSPPIKMVSFLKLERESLALSKMNLTISETYSPSEGNCHPKSKGAARSNVSIVHPNSPETNKKKTRRVSFSKYETYFNSDGESYKLSSKTGRTSRGKKRSVHKRRRQKIILVKDPLIKVDHGNTSDSKDSAVLREVNFTRYLDKNGEINLLNDKFLSKPPIIKIIGTG